jgi:Spy/CpxP family protein refolding chaperone
MDKVLRIRLTTVLVLAAVFLAGLVLGLAVDRSLIATPAREEARTEEEGQPSQRRGAMYEQVGPTEAQKIVIDSIVDEYRTAMRALHAEFRAAYDPRYAALLRETRAAIKGVLTPEQAHQYDSLVAARDSAAAERERQRAEGSPRDEGDRDEGEET